MVTLLPPDFHPVLREWWATRFAEPTEAQLDGWRAIRRGDDTLIAAPTGSGKTLAAFLTSIDQLLREGIEQGGLPDEVRVIYVSPLKALSADIHKNLAVPRREIHTLSPVKITAAVRSGDTPSAERAAMLRTPPHILVTTPESLYLLLTAERSRQMLKSARVVIVDEIHAVLQSRRGAHLALSLERLDHIAGRPLQRIGLSAAGDGLLGDAEADRGGGTLPHAQALHHRRQGPPPQDGPGGRGAELAARGGDVARGLGRDLPAAGAAHRRASHHAHHREHPPARRAHGAPALRAAG